MATIFSLFTPEHRVSRPRSPGFRPQLEALEERWCPSGGTMEWSDPMGNQAMAMAVQRDGKTVVVGSLVQNGGNAILVRRLNGDGSVDTTFNKTGSVTVSTSGDNDQPEAVALQPDGKILVGGSRSKLNGNSSGELIARLNANGAMDTTFGYKGIWQSNAGGAVEKLAVLSEPAHSTTVTAIIVADQANLNGTPCFGVLKLTPAGQLDKTFGTGGVAVFANITADRIHPVSGVAIAPSGEIYLAGTADVLLSGYFTDQTGCVAAVTPAGALDTSFGSGTGYVQMPTEGGDEASDFFDLTIQTLTVNGQTVSRLLAAGKYSTASVLWDGFVIAYSLSGTLDTTFGSGGSFTFVNPPWQDANSEFRSLALEADGSIVVGGGVTYNPNTEWMSMLVGHLTADGTADTSFGTNGTGFVTFQLADQSEVFGLAIEPTNGDILICGYTEMNGYQKQEFVARLSGS